MLWLGESDIQWLANRRGEAIRCWIERCKWQGDRRVVEKYELVLTCIPEEKHTSDDIPPVVDISCSDDHYDRLLFNQERFRVLRLQPTECSRYNTRDGLARFDELRAEMDALDSPGPSPQAGCAPPQPTRPGDGSVPEEPDKKESSKSLAPRDTTPAQNGVTVLNLYAPVKLPGERWGLVFGGAVDSDDAAALAKQVSSMFPSQGPRVLLGVNTGRPIQSYTKDELESAHRGKMMTEHPTNGGSAKRKDLVDLALSVLLDQEAIKGWQRCGWPGVHAVLEKKEEVAGTLVDMQPHAQSVPRFAVVAHPDGRATVIPIAELRLIEEDREQFESSRPLLLPSAGKLFSKAALGDSPSRSALGAGGERADTSGKFARGDEGGGKRWKQRGDGASGSRLSSECPAALATTAAPMDLSSTATTAAAAQQDRSSTAADTAAPPRNPSSAPGPSVRGSAPTDAQRIAQQVVPGIKRRTRSQKRGREEVDLT